MKWYIKDPNVLQFYFPSQCRIQPSTTSELYFQDIANDAPPQAHLVSYSLLTLAMPKLDEHELMIRKTRMY